eukprot:CAMPEP_0179440940 /NCGR_PEP_ID=MMETSP0799-20121207/24558_1 /TAXON_ID=46947 /ORGANISM="Geminigera cryophila, Strain CCMP2564" /LENGTH=190 /DNA_ID=CAMNT_0021224829 /DNA_START=75 /DNA_END=644 /DNA_ORIENTATION=-
MESPAGTRSSLESPDISTASALRGLPAHDIGANNGMSQLLGGVVAEGSQSGGEHAADSDGGINGADELAEGVVSLKMILDHLTNQQARTLIRLANDDVNLAVAMYFDDTGVADESPVASAAIPAADAECAEQDDVFADLAAISLQEGGRGGSQQRDVQQSAVADRGPAISEGTPGSEPREALEHGNGANG